MGRNSVVFIKYVKVTPSLLFTRFSFSSDISAIELSTKKGQRNFVLLFFKFHGITFRSPLGLNFVEYFCIKWYVLIETCEIFTILLDEKHVTPNQTVPKSHGYFLLLVLLGDKDQIVISDSFQNFIGIFSNMILEKTWYEKYILYYCLGPHNG